MTTNNWNQNYDSCRSFAQEINQKISDYQKLSNGSVQRAKLSATIRTMTNELNKDIDKLSTDLTSQSRDGIITSREADRRRTMIDTLKQMKGDIELTMREVGGGATPNNRMDPRLLPVSETEQTQRLTNEEFVEFRSNLRKNNDEAIEALHTAVKRQKEIGIAMNTEVDRHNEIIDTITDRTALLDSRVKRQTMLVKTVQRKSSACALWLVIIFLLIAIIVIVAVPFGK